MFSDIRSRLIISYVVVILVALTVSFAALTLISRPLQVRLAQYRLTTEMNTVVRPLLPALEQDLLLRQVSRAELSTYLNNRLPPQSSRLLVLGPMGRVLFDSKGSWTNQILELSPPRRQRLNFSEGSFVGPDNTSMLYSAIPLRADPSDTVRAYVALVAPLPKTVNSLILDLWSGFMIAGLLAFFVSVLLGLAIVRSVTSPLQAIAQASEAVAQGDYSQKIPDTGPDEIKQVAGAFNRMIQQVQASQIAMRDFVSNVSHELKTPLTSIQGFSQALLEGAAHNATARKRAAGIIHNEATRMRRLVEDLLELARIDAGQIVMDKHPIDLIALLNVTLDNQTPQAAAKKITLIRRLDGLPSVVGDGDRLKQVFTNLIDNAIKHTPSGGKIGVKGAEEIDPKFNDSALKGLPIRPGRRYARVSIIDTGPGIPQEDLNRIFERFYQVDKSRKQSQGVGLGLAIAYNIVKAHSGHIQAQSAPNQGTQFTIWLPTSEADITTLISKRK